VGNEGKRNLKQRTRKPTKGKVTTGFSSLPEMDAGMKSKITTNCPSKGKIFLLNTHLSNVPKDRRKDGDVRENSTLLGGFQLKKNA
jgi:hypothetical protein